jgi:sodium-dependent dicarboxylate transporter 2/3/5
MAIALGIFEKLKLRAGESQFGKAVMLGIPIGALIGGVGTPAGSAINILGLSMIEQQGGPRIPFLYWMALGIPMVMVMLPIAAWVITKFYPPEIKTIGDIREIHAEREAMGPIRVTEWKVIAIMAVMMTLWISSTWIAALDVTLIAVAGACVMFLPGIQLMNWQEAQGAIGWEVLVMFGGINSLGAISASSGLAKWMVNASLAGLENWRAVWVIMLISAFTVVVHLMLPSNPVINVVMIPPIMVLAMSAGKNPALYALPVAFTASCAFLLPLESVPLVTFSKGYYRMFDMFIPGVIISAVWVVVMTTVLLLIGPMVGLF